jgi:hypothetical protein
MVHGESEERFGWSAARREHLPELNLRRSRGNGLMILGLDKWAFPLCVKAEDRWVFPVPNKNYSATK